jgi:hypothetical protein
MLSNVLGVDVDEIQPEEDINTIPKLEIIQNKLITPQNSGKLII